MLDQGLIGWSGSIILSDRLGENDTMWAEYLATILYSSASAEWLEDGVFFFSLERSENLFKVADSWKLSKVTKFAIALVMKSTITLRSAVAKQKTNGPQDWFIFPTTCSVKNKIEHFNFRQKQKKKKKKKLNSLIYVLIEYQLTWKNEKLLLL